MKWNEILIVLVILAHRPVILKLHVTIDKITLRAISQIMETKPFGKSFS